MVKKTLIILAALLVVSCATAPRRQGRPPFYLESLPQTIIIGLSLEERIEVEEAWKQLKNGNGQKALRILYQLGVRSPAYHVGLGYANILLNRYDSSEKHFKEGMNEYPDMILIHLGLAQLYQKTGQENLAFSEYSKVLERNPEHRFAKQEYGELKAAKTKEALNEGKYYLTIDNPERAKEAFLRALYYTPNSREAHLSLAGILKAEGSRRDALVHLEALSAIEPKNATILKDYANTLYEDRRYEKSLDIYEKVLALKPDDREARTRVENIRNRLGIFELPSQYLTIPSKQEISREDVAALLAVKFQDFLDATETKPPILGDIATSWASKYILKITSLGILDPFPNHTFQPNKILTRAEMAEILMRLIELLKQQGYRFIQQIPPERIQIVDVSPENYFYKSITQVVSYQIMTLTAEQRFRSEHPVSGEEAMQTVSIILNLIK